MYKICAGIRSKIFGLLKSKIQNWGENYVLIISFIRFFIEGKNPIELVLEEPFKKLEPFKVSWR